jgi:hypothetical protein
VAVIELQWTGFSSLIEGKMARFGVLKAYVQLKSMQNTGAKEQEGFPTALKKLARSGF